MKFLFCLCLLLINGCSLHHNFQHRKAIRLERIECALKSKLITEQEAKNAREAFIYDKMPSHLFWLSVGQPDSDLINVSYREDHKVEYHISAVAGGLQGQNDWKRLSKYSPTKPGIDGKRISRGSPTWTTQTDTLRAVFENDRLLIWDQ